MTLKTKIFIGLTLWSLTSNYYSSDNNSSKNDDSELILEEQYKKISELLSKIKELKKIITSDGKYDFYNGSLGIYKRYISLLYDEDYGYIHINTDSFQINIKFNTINKDISLLNPRYKDLNKIQEDNSDYKNIINLLNKSKEYQHFQEPIANLLKGESIYEAKKEILEKVKDELKKINMNKIVEIDEIKKINMNKIVEIDEIKKLLNNIDELKKILYDDESLKKDYDNIKLLSNPKDKNWFHITIWKNGDICFYDENNKWYQKINLLGGGISIDSSITPSQIQKNNEKIIDLLSKQYPSLIEPIKNLLKEQEQSTYYPREVVLNVIKKELEKTVKKQEEERKRYVEQLRQQQLKQEQQLKIEQKKLPFQSGLEPIQKKINDEKLEKQEGEEPKVEEKSKWKIWIIGIIVASLAFLSLWRYGMSRKEKNNYTIKEDEKDNIKISEIYQ